MSILRSFTYQEFQFIDQYGLEESGVTNSLHVASAGMGASLLHIAIAEIKDNDYNNSIEAEVNLSLEEAKILLKHIEAFVECNQGKWLDEDYHGLRLK